MNNPHGIRVYRIPPKTMNCPLCRQAMIYVKGKAYFECPNPKCNVVRVKPASWRKGEYHDIRVILAVI